NFAHGILVLWPYPKVGVNGRRFARGNGASRYQGAHGIQVVTNAKGFVVALYALFWYPCRCKVVLDHTDPAIIGLLGVILTPLVQIREADFLVFVFGRINCRARKGAVERRATGLIAIAL